MNIATTLKQIQSKFKTNLNQHWSKIETNLKTNDFWLSSILNAAKYNQNIEQLTYLNSIVDSITLNEIAKLAKQLLDNQYFERVSYLSE